MGSWSLLHLLDQFMVRQTSVQQVSRERIWLCSIVDLGIVSNVSIQILLSSSRFAYWFWIYIKILVHIYSWFWLFYCIVLTLNVYLLLLLVIVSGCFLEVSVSFCSVRCHFLTKPACFCPSFSNSVSGCFINRIIGTVIGGWKMSLQSMRKSSWRHRRRQRTCYIPNTVRKQFVYTQNSFPD